MTKFQKLTKREKVEHIWEYYRYHIIGGLIGTFVMVSLLTTIFGPRPPEPAVSVVIMGIYRQEQDMQNHFKEEIEDIIQNDEDGKVEVTMLPANWDETSPMDMAMNQKLALMFQTREIDIMIVEEAKFDSFITNMQERVYFPLDGETELVDILEANTDKLKHRSLPGDPNDRVYGLSVKNNKKLQAIGLTDDYVVSIPAVTDKKENALKVIKWLYQ